MTDQKSKYEEAAKAKYPGWFDDYEDGIQMSAYVAGASFAEKEAHNTAINKAIS